MSGTGDELGWTGSEPAPIGSALVVLEVHSMSSVSGNPTTMPASAEACARPLRSRYLACPILLAVVLGLTLAMPHGIVIYAFYAIAVISSLPTWDRRFVRQMSLAAVVFVLLDAALLQQTVTSSWERLLNCGAGLLAIWAALHLSLEAITAYEARLREETRRAQDLAKAGELAGHMVMLCAWTNRVKEQERWIPLDEFLERHFHVRISHGMSDDVRQNLIRSATDHAADVNPDPQESPP